MKKNILIIVLGDLEKSPRMSNHINMLKNDNNN